MLIETSETEQNDYFFVNRLIFVGKALRGNILCLPVSCS